MRYSGVRSSHAASGRRSLAAGIAVATLALALACAAAAAISGDAAKPVLNIGVGSPPNSLDPAKDGAAGNWLRQLAYEPLIVAHPDGTFSAGLATSWKYMKPKAQSLRANKDFEFTLRHDAKFSDGTPVTGQAVKSWFLYFQNTKGPFISDMGPVSSFETVGKWTVVIHLQSPNPRLVATLSKYWGEVASPACTRAGTLATQTCGAGPYTLDTSQTVTGDHYTLVPNPDFYDKSAIKWSKIVWKVVPSASSLLQAMQSGQIDVGGGDPSTADAAARAGIAVLHAATGNTVLFLDAGGVISKPLADVRVRQALNYAIDRKALAPINGKTAKPTVGLAAADGQDPKYANYYTYNPAKAKALLAAAGYANGFTIDGVITIGWVPSNLQMMQGIAKYLAAVGVTLNLHVSPNAGDWIQHVLGPGAPIYELGSNTSDSMYNVYTFELKPKSLLNNLGGHGWDDPVLDHLWVKGARAADPKVYWRQMADRVITQAYFLPVASSDTFTYVNSKKVKGVVAGPYGGGVSYSTEWVPAK
jgi:peptide/nickel transport system substrate-binding protein